MNNWKSKLKKFNPCEDSLIWISMANINTPEQAYKECKRGDWLLWLAGQLKIDRKLIVLAACDCAELALKHIPKGENRPKQAIETARAWTRGEASLGEVRDAANAAANAAYAAYAATHTAAYAAEAAANVAEAAANAAAYAAEAAAYAAYAGYAADAAYAAANAATAQQCADITRKHIPFKLFEEALK